MLNRGQGWCKSVTNCLERYGVALHVYPAADGKASGSWYTDDGVSFEHETDQAFLNFKFTYDGQNFLSEVVGGQWDLAKAPKIEVVYIHNVD